MTRHGRIRNNWGVYWRPVGYSLLLLAQFKSRERAREFIRNQRKKIRGGKFFLYKNPYIRYDNY